MHMDQENLPKTSHTQKRRSAFLSMISEPAGMLLGHQYHTDFAFLGLTLRGGSVILKHWSDTGVGSYSVLPRSKGYSCSLVFVSQVVKRWSLAVSFSAYQAPNYTASLNLRWNFRIRRVMPHNSSCLVAIKRGDLRTIQHQLSSQELQLTDSISEGYSLLHVSGSCLWNEIIGRLTMVDVVCCTL
jgi:hypothetical protein